MNENIKIYKKVSLDIVKAINNDNIDTLESLFTKRQVILDEVEDSEMFKKKLIKEGILEIDNNIKVLLANNLEKVKQEIKEYRVSKSANNSYMNFNKEKLNIFNKKV